MLSVYEVDCRRPHERGSAVHGVVGEPGEVVRASRRPRHHGCGRGRGRAADVRRERRRARVVDDVGGGARRAPVARGVDRHDGVGERAVRRRPGVGVGVRRRAASEDRAAVDVVADDPARRRAAAVARGGPRDHRTRPGRRGRRDRGRRRRGGRVDDHGAGDRRGRVARAVERDDVVHVGARHDGRVGVGVRRRRGGRDQRPVPVDAVAGEARPAGVGHGGPAQRGIDAGRRGRGQRRRGRRGRVVHDDLGGRRGRRVPGRIDRLAPSRSGSR